MSGPHIGTCKHCGKQTEYRYKSWVKDYCSHACSNTAKWEKRPRAEVKSYQCVNCEKPFSLLAHRSSHREKAGKAIKYCSVECGKFARSKDGTFVDATCAHCGKAFRRRADKIESRTFCSRDCFGASCRTEGGTWSANGADVQKRRAYFRRYISENRERINAGSRQWARQNRDYRNYVGLMRRASGRLTLEELKKIKAAAGGKCQVCGDTNNLHVDHIVPVARGGKTELGNLQLLCRFCNISKGAKPFTEWLPHRLKELSRGG